MNFVKIRENSLPIDEFTEEMVKSLDSLSAADVLAKLFLLAGNIGAQFSLIKINESLNSLFRVQETDVIDGRLERIKKAIGMFNTTIQKYTREFAKETAFSNLLDLSKLRKTVIDELKLGIRIAKSDKQNSETIITAITDLVNAMNVLIGLYNGAINVENQLEVINLLDLHDGINDDAVRSNEYAR